MQLHEQYRPHSWSDVIGQDKALAKIEALRKRGLGGRVFWITGKSGSGKTTIARLIAAELSEPYCIVEIDGADLTMDRVREFQDQCRMRPIGGGIHVFIVNEAHSISSRVIARLNTALEAEHVERNSTWIFTTTIEGEKSLFDGEIEANPFLSRASIVALAQMGCAQAFAERARTIAQAEGLDGKPIGEYVKLLQKHHNNLRAALQEIEAGGMIGGAT